MLRPLFVGLVRFLLGHAHGGNGREGEGDGGDGVVIRCAVLSLEQITVEDAGFIGADRGEGQAAIGAVADGVDVG